MNLVAKERLSKVKAIYFDLDDTLCGYWNASKAGLREAFRQHPIGLYSMDEMFAAWAEAFSIFSPALKDNAPLYEEYLTSGAKTRLHQMQVTLTLLKIEDPVLAEKLSQTYMVERDKNLKLFDDCISVLDQLKDKFPLGLITNGPADIQNQEVDTLGIRDYFQNIFIEGEMRIGKPNQEVFDRAAAAVGLGPEELLMVGNSYGHDIRPAIDFGWATVWTRRDSDVPTSSKTGKPEELPSGAPEPDLTVENLSDILPYLE